MILKLFHSCKKIIYEKIIIYLKDEHSGYFRLVILISITSISITLVNIIADNQLQLIRY